MGILVSFYKESFPSPSRFDVERDIPDLTGQVIIVTGGNAGVGRETCKALLRKNAKVYLGARSKTKADEAIEWLKNETGGKAPVFLELDLASLASIKKAVKEFQTKETELHVLFNNAGVMIPPVEQTTADGYDLQFGTNVLGHFYFTKLLLPTLISTANSSPSAKGNTRVVNTSSGSAILAPEDGVVWATLGRDNAALVARKKLGTQSLYSQSKWGNIVLSKELAKRYADQGIVSTSLNPGNIKTDLQRYMKGIQAKIVDMILWPAPYGALTQLWAGTTAEGAGFSGKYLVPWARIGKAPASTENVALGEKLWDWLEEQVKDI